MNLGSGPAHAMLFFTADAGLILGLSVDAGCDMSVGDRAAKSGLLGSANLPVREVGYITFETPPVDSVEKFKQVVEEIENATRHPL